MPLTHEDNFSLAENTRPIRVELEPARSALESLLMLTKNHRMPGVADEWVARTQQAMSKEERDTNELVMIGLHFVVWPQGCWNSFSAYLNDLTETPPETLRDRMLDVYDAKLPAGAAIDRQAALASPDAYVAYLRQGFHADQIDEQVERQAYNYVIDPPALQRLVVDHLRHMWERFLALDWERQRPEMRKILRAYQGLDFTGKTFREAARLVTGENLASEKWEHIFTHAHRLTFVPHPYAGNALPCSVTHSGEAYVFFTPQPVDDLLSGAQELSLTEMIVRLSALSDDVRLRILRQIAENGELRSQEIMEALDLRQSAASRHLAQLVATGFLSERRCDGAKCYSLNATRVAGTLQALASYLLVGERSER
jgi:DNA-binding transcriptional ArsR family regulator